MIRGSTVVLAAVTVASAYGLYALSYSTRAIEAKLQARERAQTQLTTEIDLLRAERAFLSRPERIEPLARMQGLQPAAPQQFIRPDEVFSSARPEAR